MRGRTSGQWGTQHRTMAQRAGVGVLLAVAWVGGARAMTVEQVARLTTGDGTDIADFGCAVAVEADTAVIGADRADTVAASLSGAAYVFVRNGGSWTQQAELTAADGTPGKFLGRWVSVSGDTAVVGAPGDDHAGSWSGAAYVFVRSGTSWTQQAKLTAGDASAGANFGECVSLSGDVAVIGAYGDDHAGGYSGSAYVFVRDGGAWTQEAKLVAPDAPAAGEYFGYPVSVDGDTIIVGRYGDTDFGYTSGAAHVFVRTAEGWAHQAKLTAVDASPQSSFGFAVSVSGDTALIGATDDHENGPYSGSAYVFVREGATWTQQAKLTAPDAAATDFFGWTASLSGEVAVVGAPDDDDGGYNSGSVYVFLREGSTWTQQAKLGAIAPSPNVEFGWTVAVSADALLVGAPWHEPGDGGWISGSVDAFSVTFTPAEQIDALASQVVAVNLANGISDSLDAKLDTALNALDDANANNDVAATNSLEAFILAVQAQSGNQIPEPDADVLVLKATTIVAQLGGGS